MLSLETKKELIDLGYLKEIVHPNGELFLYNYTQTAQFDKEAFAKYPILRSCRGLILDAEGNIIARPFEKFWNFEEYGVGSTLGELPPYHTFEITDKMDGSLGILYCYKGNVAIATRGSFDSEQAMWATQYLHQNFPDLVKKHAESVSLAYTTLFEIIYPENRIVVSYGDTKQLILLAVVDNETGKDLNIHLIQALAFKYNLPCVHHFDGVTEFDTIREQLPRDNAEGFVVRFDNGLRVKLKYEEYVRLHKILTGISSKTIWEMLKAGDDLKILVEKVPDEFHKWVNETIKELKLRYEIIETDAKMSYILCKDFPTRKDKAIYLMEHEKDLAPVVFKMLDKKSYSDIIWGMIKPQFEKPFKKEI